MNIEELVLAMEEAVPDIDSTEFDGLDEDEALGYAVTRLEAAGIDDPIAFLIDKGVLEA